MNFRDARFNERLEEGRLRYFAETGDGKYLRSCIASAFEVEVTCVTVTWPDEARTPHWGQTFEVRV
jgi:hypothetical protein